MLEKVNSVQVTDRLSPSTLLLISISLLYLRSKNCETTLGSSPKDGSKLCRVKFLKKLPVPVTRLSADLIARVWREVVPRYTSVPPPQTARIIGELIGSGRFEFDKEGLLKL